MVIRATSFSDVSEMAMVPDSECRMPTLMVSAAATGPTYHAAAIEAPSSVLRNCLRFIEGPLASV